MNNLNLSTQLQNIENLEIIIKIVDKTTFLENILQEWKDIFIKEYNDFWNLGILKWFYVDNIFI